MEEADDAISVVVIVADGMLGVVDAVAATGVVDAEAVVELKALEVAADVSEVSEVVARGEEIVEAAAGA